MNQSAIAMLQKTIEFMSKETCIELMPEMIPPLLMVSRFLFSFIIIYSINYLTKTTNPNKVWDTNSHNLIGGESVRYLCFFLNSMPSLFFTPRPLHVICI